jgi:hypothetical protein
MDLLGFPLELTVSEQEQIPRGCRDYGANVDAETAECPGCHGSIATDSL